MRPSIRHRAIGTSSNAHNPRNAQVEGIAARTVTTHLLFWEVRPRERLGATVTLIESRDGELEIGDSLRQVQHPSGKIEFVRGYQCDGELEAGIWVRLPDGTTGWAYRESFDGTIDWSAGRVVGGPGT
jgi:hypothetical protein